MKKWISLFLIGVLLFVTGCEMMGNTPKDVVEDYLTSYQKRDDSFVEQLEEYLDGENLEEEVRKDYQELLEKQHDNLSYEIKKEEINKDKSTVEVEIEVLDYRSNLDQSKKYFLEHQEEFTDQVVDENNIDSLKEFIEYKIKELKNVEDKTKYTTTFELIKVDGSWEIKDIDNDTFMKLYGLY